LRVVPRHTNVLSNATRHRFPIDRSFGKVTPGTARVAQHCSAPCPFFKSGACRFGDSCRRRHDSLDGLQSTFSTLAVASGDKDLGNRHAAASSGSFLPGRSSSPSNGSDTSSGDGPLNSVEDTELNLPSPLPFLTPSKPILTSSWSLRTRPSERIVTSKFRKPLRLFSVHATNFARSAKSAAPGCHSHHLLLQAASLPASLRSSAVSTTKQRRVHFPPVRVGRGQHPPSEQAAALISAMCVCALGVRALLISVFCCFGPFCGRGRPQDLVERVGFEVSCRNQGSLPSGIGSKAIFGVGDRPGLCVPQRSLKSGQAGLQKP
jgi:hypothetical protein